MGITPKEDHMTTGVKLLLFVLIVGGLVSIIALVSCSGDTNTALGMGGPSGPSFTTCGEGLSCVRNCTSEQCVNDCVMNAGNAAELTAWITCIQGYCQENIWDIVPQDACLNNLYEFARDCWCHQYMCYGEEAVADLMVSQVCP